MYSAPTAIGSILYRVALLASCSCRIQNTISVTYARGHQT
jgi:hypothetical protein